MLFLLVTLIFKPKKWQVGSSEVKRDGGIKMVLYFFLIGLYAGYLQMGIGIMILAVLVFRHDTPWWRPMWSNCWSLWF